MRMIIKNNNFKNIDKIESRLSEFQKITKISHIDIDYQFKKLFIYIQKLFLYQTAQLYQILKEL